jgi:hypothetical protein
MEPGRVEILTADASRQAFSVKDLAEVWQDHGRERMVRTLQDSAGDVLCRLRAARTVQ